MSDRIRRTTAAGSARAHAVARYRVLISAHDQALERIAGLAARFFAAPRATVSIVEDDRIWFVASYGFAPQTRQVAREEGLCASAVRGDAPYVVQDTLTDPRASANQFAGDYGIRFYAGAPMVSPDGHRVGVLAVLDTDSRTASKEQLAILTDLAVIAMEQLESRVTTRNDLRAERWLRGAAEDDRDEARRDRDDAQLDRDEARRDRDSAQLDRDVAVRDRGIAEHDRDLIAQYASVLQRTLLPPLLPQVDGLTLASHYHPASSRQVGGDFYDVFALGDDRWAFFIGDVEGHGADAAVVTSLIRYTLRSAALHYNDPSDALAELNSVLLREVDPRRFCTVLLGTLQPCADGPGFDVTIATGGHHPALLIDAAERTVEQIRPEHGMLVGLIAGGTFDSCSLRLTPGQTLFCYTDGIVESRHAEIPFGEDDLAAFVTERAALDAVGLMDGVVALIPKLNPDDDIALLAFGVD